jgi:hypothetical protein
MSKLSRRTWSQLLLACEAVALALAVLIGSEIVSGFGQWYSSYLPLRLQTEALLHGHLALGTSASALQWDLAWSKGGVHQVWGLGIPLWRLPFEAIAKVLGYAGFPDRLCFGFALAILYFIVLKT